MPASAHSAGVVYAEIPSGGTTYDDTDAGFSYSAGWTSSTKAGAYDGSYRYTGTPGASVSFDFYGDDFSILYTGHTSRGEMDVYVDDVLVGTFSQYAAALTYQVQWDYPGTLSLDDHTLRLEHAGPGGTYISLDAVIVSAP